MQTLRWRFFILECNMQKLWKGKRLHLHKEKEVNWAHAETVVPNDNHSCRAASSSRTADWWEPCPMFWSMTPPGDTASSSKTCWMRQGKSTLVGTPLPGCPLSWAVRSGHPGRGVPTFFSYCCFLCQKLSAFTAITD